MIRSTLAGLAVFFAATAAFAQPYSISRNGDVVRLADARAETTVSILTSVGNIAFEMNVKGQNVLYWPYASIEEFKARPGMSGIPFLGPWIDRLDEQAFFATVAGSHSTCSSATCAATCRVTGSSRPPIAGTSWRQRPTRRRLGDEPAGVLPAADVDETVAVRAHDRDHASPARRRARSGDGHRQHERGADADRDRVPPVLPADRLASRRVDAVGRRADALAAHVEQSTDRRHRADRAVLPDSASRIARRLQPRRCVHRSACGTRRAGRRSRSAESRSGSNRAWPQLPGGDDLVAEGPAVHLHRADGRHHRRAESRGARTVQGIQSVAPGGTWRERFWIKASGY